MENNPARVQGRDTNKDHPSLLEEMGGIIQSILHHLTVLVFLSMRLFMLPVAFWYHKLENTIDLAGPSVWHSTKGWTFTLLDLVPNSMKQHLAVIECIRRLYCLHHSAKKMVRIAFALYSLGMLLDDNPDLLRSRRSSSTSHANRTRNSISPSRRNNAITYHATASQVYHAALANDHNTLDDLLAGFTDNTERDHAGQGSRRASGNLDIDCQRCEHRARFRNSSIQTTPERIFTPQKTHFEDREASRNIDGGLGSSDEHTVTQLSSRTEDSPITTLPPSLPSASDVIPTARPRSEPFAGERQSIESKASSYGPEGCPREEARQAQSSLPRRRSSPPDLGSEPEVEVPTQKRRSIASIEPITPTRKGKLQPRAKTQRV